MGPVLHLMARLYAVKATSAKRSRPPFQPDPEAIPTFQRRPAPGRSAPTRHRQLPRLLSNKTRTYLNKKSCFTSRLLASSSYVLDQCYAKPRKSTMT
jgi:hypothetical protein